LTGNEQIKIISPWETIDYGEYTAIVIDQNMTGELIFVDKSGNT
jgi:hypothetical protein